MKVEVSWRGVAIIFIITTIILGALSLFLTFQSNPPKPSELEKYLKEQNDLLKRQQDSLYSLINLQNVRLAEKDKILNTLAIQKKQVQIVYYEKYQKIDGFSVGQLTNEFDTLFSKAPFN
jgi:hypothetical protein